MAKVRKISYSERISKTRNVTAGSMSAKYIQKQQEETQAKTLLSAVKSENGRLMLDKNIVAQSKGFIDARDEVNYKAKNPDLYEAMGGIKYIEPGTKMGAPLASAATYDHNYATNLSNTTISETVDRYNSRCSKGQEELQNIIDVLNSGEWQDSDTMKKYSDTVNSYANDYITLEKLGYFDSVSEEERESNIKMFKALKETLNNCVNYQQNLNNKMDKAYENYQQVKKHDNYTILEEAFNYIGGLDMGNEDARQEYYKAAQEYYSTQNMSEDDIKNRKKELKALLNRPYVSRKEKSEIRKELSHLNAVKGQSKDLNTAIEYAMASIDSGIVGVINGFSKTANTLIGKPIETIGRALGFNIPESTALLENEKSVADIRMNSLAYQSGDKYVIAGNLARAITQTVPTVIVAYLTGGSSLASSSTLATTSSVAISSSAVTNFSTKAVQTINSLAKNPVYWTSFSMTYGNDYEQAMEYSGNPVVASAFAFVDSSFSAYVEIGSGVENLADDGAKILTNKQKAIKVWESWYEEGGEELIQNNANRLLSWIMYSDSIDSNEEFVSYLKELGYESLMGAFAGGFMGSGQMTFQSIVNFKSDTELKSLGDTILSSNNSVDIISELKSYFSKSLDMKLRKIANNIDINNPDAKLVGALYQSLCRDINTAVNLQKTTEAAADGLRMVINQAGTESKIIYSMAIPQYIGTVSQFDIDTTAAANNVLNIIGDVAGNSNINNGKTTNNKDVIEADIEVVKHSGQVVASAEIGSVPNNPDRAAPDVVEGADGRQYFDDGSGDEYFGDPAGTDENAHLTTADGGASPQGEAMGGGSFDLTEPTQKDIARAPSTQEAIDEAITGKQKTNIQRHIVDICKKLFPNITVEFVNGLKTNGKFVRSQNKILIRSDLNAVQMYVEVFKHEFMHRLETKQLYSKFFNFCFKKSKAFEQYVRTELKTAGVDIDAATREGVLEAYTNYKYEQYRNSRDIPKVDRNAFTKENAQEEIIADFFARILFQGKKYRARIIEALQNADGEALIGIGDEISSEAALLELQEKEPTLFEQVVQWFKDVINRLRGLPQAKSLVEQLDNEVNLLESMVRRAYQSKDSKRLMRDKFWEVKCKIMSFNDGTKYVDITTDQDRFNGLTVDEMQKEAKKAIKENFVGKVIGINNRTFVNSRSAGEYSYPSKFIKNPDITVAKMRASTELDNLVEIGTNYRNEPDGLYGHSHPKAKGGFDYYDTIFKVGDRYYFGTVNIMLTDRGKLLKDITKIRDVSNDIIAQYGSAPQGEFVENIPENIISNSEGVVNNDDSKRLMKKKLADEKYSVGEVIDSVNNFNYNDNSIKEGESYNGKNTELLERGAVSAANRGNDVLWQPGTNSAKLKSCLEISSGSDAELYKAIRAGESGWFDSRTNTSSEKAGQGYTEGIFRKIRGVSLSGRDTIGGIVDPEILKKFKDTVCKDEKGNLLSFYHWTDKVFDKFTKGEFGFHFGTLQVAYERDLQLKKDNPNITRSIYKEIFLNITNPIELSDDSLEWNAGWVAIQLLEKGIIDEQEYDNILKLPGIYDNTYNNPAAQSVRNVLAKNGYDGIIYENLSEDIGSYSLIALYPEQIITVAENGVLKKNNGVSRAISKEEIASLYLKETQANRIATDEFIEGSDVRQYFDDGSEDSIPKSNVTGYKLNNISKKDYDKFFFKKPIKVSKTEWVQVNSARTQKYLQYNEDNIPDIDFFRIAEYNQVDIAYKYWVRNYNKYNFEIVSKIKIKPEVSQMRLEEKNYDETAYTKDDSTRVRLGPDRNNSFDSGYGQAIRSDDELVGQGDKSNQGGTANNGISDSRREIDYNITKATSNEEVAFSMPIGNRKRNVENNAVELSRDNELSKKIGDLHGAEKYKVIQQYILDVLSGQEIVLSDGKIAVVDKSDAQHIARGAGDKKTTQISDIKKIIKKAVLVAEEDSTKERKFDYFYYYEADVKYEGEIFNIYLNVGRATNDKSYHLYDITQKLRDTAHRLNDVGRPPINKGCAVETVSPDNILPKTDKNVNNDYSTNTDNIEYDMINEQERSYIQIICDKLGRTVVFEDLREMYYKGEIISPDGYIENGVIHLNLYAENPIGFVFKHELTHFAERSQNYAEFVSQVKDSSVYKKWLCKKMGESNVKIAQYKYKQMVANTHSDSYSASHPKAEAEMIADFVGEMLFTENGSGMLALTAELDTKPRNAVVRFITDFISWIKKKLSGIKTLTLELSRLEDRFNELLSDAKNNIVNDNEIKFSFAGSRGAEKLYDTPEASKPENDQEWSEFNRQFANKTSDLKNHKQKNIIICTKNNVYFVSASGYMAGCIDEKMHIDGNEENINKMIKEYSDGTFAIGKIFGSSVEGKRRKYRRGDRDIIGAEGRDGQSENVDLDERQPESDDVGYNWENYGYKTWEELIDAIDSGVLIMDDNGNILAVEKEKYIKATLDDEVAFSMPVGKKNNANDAISEREQKYVQTICNKLGRAVVFEDLREMYYKGEIISPDGYIENGVIHLNLYAENPIGFVFKHELTHFAEKASGYSEFVRRVKDSNIYKKWLCEKTGESDVKIAEYKYKQMVANTHSDIYSASDPKAEAEMIADFVGEMLFTDNGSGMASLVSDVEVKHRNKVVQFVVDFISWLKKKISGIKTLTLEMSVLEDSFNRIVSEATDLENKGLYKYDDDISFCFVACTDQERINAAEELERQGYNRLYIFENCGLIRDAYGKWKYELNTREFRFYPDGNAKTDSHYFNYKLQKPDGSFKGRLCDFVLFNSLFELYPQLKDITVIIKKANDTVRFIIAENDEKENDKEPILFINQTLCEEHRAKENYELKSYILRELQRAIQYINGEYIGKSLMYWENMEKEGKTPYSESFGRKLTAKEAHKYTADNYEAKIVETRRALRDILTKTDANKGRTLSNIDEVYLYSTSIERDMDILFDENGNPFISKEYLIPSKDNSIPDNNEGTTAENEVVPSLSDGVEENSGDSFEAALKKNQNSNELRRFLSAAKMIDKNDIAQNLNIRAGSDSLISDVADNAKQASEYFNQDKINELSRKILQRTDSIGRTLSDSLLEKFKNTIFKNEKGQMISLYTLKMWGVGGFEHSKLGLVAGTLEAAEQLYAQYNDGSPRNRDVYIQEIFVNMKNPLVLNYTPYEDSIRGIHDLVESEIFFYSEFLNLINQKSAAKEPTYSGLTTRKTREAIQNAGYDGIIYFNDSTDKGSMTVIVFDESQMVTVAKNGILQQNNGITADYFDLAAAEDTAKKVNNDKNIKLYAADSKYNKRKYRPVPDERIKAGSGGFMEKATSGVVNAKRELEENLAGNNEIALSGKDAAGRTLGKNITGEFDKTFFKDKNGNLLSFFAYGKKIIDLEKAIKSRNLFGTLDSAINNLVLSKEKSPRSIFGVIQEFYINSVAPLVVELDNLDAEVIAKQIFEEKIITEKEYYRLISPERKNPALVLINKLDEKGFDSIVFVKQTGECVVLPFDASQVFPVADNGIVKENSGVTQEDEIEEYNENYRIDRVVIEREGETPVDTREIRNILTTERDNTIKLKLVTKVLMCNNNPAIDYSDNRTAGHSWILEKNKVDILNARAIVTALINRDVSDISIADTDTAGRIISEHKKQLLRESKLVDKDGRPLSVFVFNRYNYNRFKHSQFGLRVSTLNAAHDISLFPKENPLANSRGSFEEYYPIVKNPYFLTFDPENLTPAMLAKYLLEEGTITNKQYESVLVRLGADRTPYHSGASNYLTRILKEKGFDCLAFMNERADPGSIGLIVFDKSQLIPVAIDGLPVENSDRTLADSDNEPAFLMSKNDSENFVEKSKENTFDNDDNNGYNEIKR